MMYHVPDISLILRLLLQIQNAKSDKQFLYLVLLRQCTDCNQLTTLIWLVYGETGQAGEGQLCLKVAPPSEVKKGVKKDA